MNKEKLYLQAFSFQSKAYDSKLNFLDSIRKAAEIGYDGIGVYTCKKKEKDFYSPEELKAVLDETGMELLYGSTPSNYPELESFGVNHYMEVARYYHIHHLDFTKTNLFSYPDQAIEYYAKLGARYICLNNCSIIVPERKDCENLANYLNDLGRRAKKYGMKATWHNHLFEFWPIDEDRVLEILIKNTDPDLVAFELDCSWCASARIRPEEFIRKYSGRFEIIQFREIDEYYGPQQPGYPEGPNYYITRLNENGDIERIPRMQQEADIIFTNCAAGKGICNWKEIKKAGDEQSCPVHYIVERGNSYNYPRDRWQCLKEDHDYFRALMNENPNNN